GLDLTPDAASERQILELGLHKGRTPTAKARGLRGLTVFESSADLASQEVAQPLMLSGLFVDRDKLSACALEALVKLEDTLEQLSRRSRIVATREVDPSQLQAERRTPPLVARPIQATLDGGYPVIPLSREFVGFQEIVYHGLVVRALFDEALEQARSLLRFAQAISSELRRFASERPSHRSVRLGLGPPEEQDELLFVIACRSAKLGQGRQGSDILVSELQDRAQRDLCFLRLAELLREPRALAQELDPLVIIEGKSGAFVEGPEQGLLLTKLLFQSLNPRQDLVTLRSQRGRRAQCSELTLEIAAPLEPLGRPEAKLAGRICCALELTRAHQDLSACLVG